MAGEAFLKNIRQPFLTATPTAVGSVTTPPNSGDVALSVDPTTLVLRIKDSAGTSWPLAALNKFDATTAPGVSNDDSEGYSPGSVWIDVTNDKAYVCLDASTGAAVWTETTGAGGGAGALQSDKVTRTNVTDVTIASSTWADVDGTNITITFTTGARRVLLGFTGRVSSSSSGVLTSFNFSVDGTPVVAESTSGRGLFVRRSEGVGVSGGVAYTFLTDVLTAASHTFKPRWNTSGGTATLHTNGTDQHAVFYAIELY